MSSSEMKATSLKSDLSELKSSISEMKNLSNMNFTKLKSNATSPLLDNMDLNEEDEEEEPVVTYPESPPPQGKRNLTWDNPILNVKCFVF